MSFDFIVKFHGCSSSSSCNFRIGVNHQGSFTIWPKFCNSFVFSVVVVVYRFCYFWNLMFVGLLSWFFYVSLSHWSLHWTLGTKSCLVLNKLSIFPLMKVYTIESSLLEAFHTQSTHHNVASSSNAKTISMNFIDLEHEPKLLNIVVNKWKYEPSQNFMTFGQHDCHGQKQWLMGMV